MFFLGLSRVLQQRLDARLHVAHVGGGLEARHDVARAVNDELGEVPLDGGLGRSLRVLGRELLLQQVLELVFAEALEALLGL